MLTQIDSISNAAACVSLTPSPVEKASACDKRPRFSTYPIYVLSRACVSKCFGFYIETAHKRCFSHLRGFTIIVATRVDC